MGRKRDLHVGFVAGGGLGAERLLEASTDHLCADVGVAKVRDADLSPGFLVVTMRQIWINSQYPGL